MARCPQGSVRLGKTLALRILDWHGGQGKPTYAVGSNALAGRCVPKPLVRRAAWELQNVLATRGRLTHPIELAKLIKVLLKRSA